MSMRIRFFIGFEVGRRSLGLRAKTFRIFYYFLTMRVDANACL